MKPPTNGKSEYERVPVYDEWIEGTIIDIEYDLQHRSTFQGEEKIGPCVRFKFQLAGCKYPHRSRWMTFSYGDKANLYKQFIAHLVDGAEPYMDFDLDALKELRVKTIWSQSGDFDNLVMIRHLKAPMPSQAEPKKEEVDVPF